MSAESAYTCAASTMSVVNQLCNDVNGFQDRIIKPEQFAWLAEDSGRIEEYLGAADNNATDGLAVITKAIGDSDSFVERMNPYANHTEPGVGTKPLYELLGTSRHATLAAAKDVHAAHTALVTAEPHMYALFKQIAGLPRKKLPQVIPTRAQTLQTCVQTMIRESPLGMAGDRCDETILSDIGRITTIVDQVQISMDNVIYPVKLAPNEVSDLPAQESMKEGCLGHLGYAARLLATSDVQSAWLVKHAAEELPSRVLTKSRVLANYQRIAQDSIVAARPAIKAHTAAFSKITEALTEAAANQAIVHDALRAIVSLAIDAWNGLDGHMVHLRTFANSQ